MINTKTQRLLCRRVPLDEKVRRLPSLKPSIAVLNNDVINVADDVVAMFLRGHAWLICVPGRIQGDNAIQAVCFSTPDFETQLVERQCRRDDRASSRIKEASAIRHHDGDPRIGKLGEWTDRRGVDRGHAVIVFSRERHRLNQEVTIGQRREAEFFEASDSPGYVLLSPLSPE